MAFRDHSKKQVSYFHDISVGNFHFGKKHPMKPHRIAMAHELILEYGLYRRMRVYCPYRASGEDMVSFHSGEYINVLKNIQAGKVTQELRALMNRLSIGTNENDCPIFAGVYEFCQIYAGGTLAAAAALNQGKSDICINWSGGLHHANKSNAAGFCYVNDIVLAIVELLKCNKRVLYIDIDVHHCGN